MTSDSQHPVVRRKKNLSPIWILPVLAFVLGLWLLYSYIIERGTTITVKFPSANGITANKTLVRYQGIVVGQVKGVKLDEDQKSVLVNINMNHTVENLLRRGTQFWLVSPKASLTGFEGLDALFSGNYIAMEPGEGPRRNEFQATLEAPPTLSRHTEGLLVRLTAPNRGSLNIGSGVYFQQVQIGEVVDFRLNNQTQEVVFDVHIQSRYQSLVRHNSQFWNSSGVAIHASRSGIDVELESLASLLSGGVVLSSPADGEPVTDGTRFKLHERARDARPRAEFQVWVESADGFSVGTPIRFRGLDLGQVQDIELTEQGVILHAYIDTEYRHLLRKNTRFARVGAQLGLDGVAHLDTLLFGDFIRLWPGDGEPHTEFSLSQEGELHREGRAFLLEHDSLEGAGVGAPVRFRGVPVGEVVEVTLTDEGVQSRIWIDAPYHQRVRQDAAFWLQSAVEVEADLAKLSVRSRPLADILSGGIAFSGGEGTEAAGQSRFALAVSESAAKSGPRVHLSLQTETPAGLAAGASVLYRDLEVGTIESLSLGKDGVTVQVGIERRYQHLINTDTRFWHHSGIKVEGSLAGINIQAAPLTTLLRGGLSFDTAIKGHENTQPGLPEDRHIYPDRHSALQGIEHLSLFIDSAAQIPAGAPIRFRGHTIGKIRSVSLSDDLANQRLEAQLDRPWADRFLAQDSQFYLVSPEIRLSGVRDPDTLITGNYIAAMPGTAEQRSDSFLVAMAPPTTLPFDDGLTLVLNQPNLGSLAVGSPVLYRQIKVGEVIKTGLAADGASVDIEIQLMPRYQHLVNQSSRFWNASGINVDVGLFSGAQISAESLETILAGGVAFATQESSNGENLLADGTRLPLHNQAQSAWLEWQTRF
ncbi:MlaD family protein [Ferrimonas gelatinilytica]|uniref:MlaD family protein n=1 Tax=Ferrimonas gelatinilytica TaxID=1255257 RepID=A0ABP9RW06_9GAMM